MMKSRQRYYRLGGRILLESGEGSRVEDTMTYIAHTLGYTESNSFVTNTVINFMLHDETYPRIFRIKQEIQIYIEYLKPIEFLDV